MIDSKPNRRQWVPPFAIRIRNAVDASFDHFKIKSTDEKKADLVARILGYTTWKKMISKVAQGGQKLREPGSKAGDKALVELFGLKMSKAKVVAQHIREGYEERDTTIKGVVNAIVARPEIARTSIEKLSLKEKDVMLLQNKGIATLGDLARQSVEVDPARMASILWNIVIPAPNAEDTSTS